MSVDAALNAAARLRSCGAKLGAGTVAFNALIRAKAEADASRKAWTPHGPIPLRPRADNDAEPSSMPGTLA